MNTWQGLTFLLAGFSAGLFVGAKYVTKPINEYTFGKVKAKGQGNEVTAIIKPSQKEQPTKKKRFQIFKRKNNSDETR